MPCRDRVLEGALYRGLVAVFAGVEERSMRKATIELGIKYIMQPPAGAHQQGQLRNFAVRGDSEYDLVRQAEQRIHSFCVVALDYVGGGC